MKTRMGTAGAAALAIGIGTFGSFAGEVTTAADDKSIVELAVGSSDLELLVTAVKSAELVEALSVEGPFTVFAPRDAAFEALGGDTIDSLLSEGSRTDLTRILTFHVVPGRIDAGDLATRRTLDTLSGQRLDIDTSGGAITVNGAGIVAADIEASNGVVHIIDSVMLPESRTIPAIASETNGFSTLVTAVKTAGLLDALAGEGPFTVLAPTDDAFAALGSDTINALLQPQNREALAQVLTYHVVPGRAFASDVFGGAEVETLNGQTVTFGSSKGRLSVNGTSIVATDIEASNGVIHVIDSVLIPDGFSLAEPEMGLIGIYPASVGSSARNALRLEHGEGIRINGLTDGGGAEDAGLRDGDIILTINGETATGDLLDEAKLEAGVGGKIKLIVAREVEVEVRRDDH